MFVRSQLPREHFLQEGWWAVEMSQHRAPWRRELSPVDSKARYDHVWVGGGSERERRRETASCRSAHDFSSRSPASFAECFLQIWGIYLSVSYLFVTPLFRLAKRIPEVPITNPTTSFNSSNQLVKGVPFPGAHLLWQSMSCWPCQREQVAGVL